LFFRVGFGYEFKKRIAVAFNSGDDLHWNYDIKAFPTYGSLKYSITEQDDSAHFVEIRYGKCGDPLPTIQMEIITALVGGKER
tara:strand:- start:83 stop:331 length:249 start_codon:yes stop_codon:yes gene_type:complete